MKSPKTVSPASVTLTPEVSEALSFWTELTGLSAQELVNHILVQELAHFNPHSTDDFVAQTLVELKYSDRQGAKRALAWAIKHTETHHGLPKKFESGVDKLPDGRFEIYAYDYDNDSWVIEPSALYEPEDMKRDPYERHLQNRLEQIAASAQ